MIDYKGIAEDLDKLYNMLLYDQMDMSNAHIIGVFASVVRTPLDSEIDDKGVLMEFSQSAIISDRLEKAFFDRDVKEVFLQMLVDEEKYELVVELEKIWN